MPTSPKVPDENRCCKNITHICGKFWTNTERRGINQELYKLKSYALMHCENQYKQSNARMNMVLCFGSMHGFLLHYILKA